MSGELILAGRTFLDRAEARATSRELARLDHQTTVQLAGIEQAADLQAAKADAVAYVGRRGMQAVALVSDLEGKLGQLCPLAVSRLQGIADMTALSIAEVVVDSAREVRGR